ncbi:hypothetical protein D1AOALGA4SA_2578 [Olavius algarvensis Delta 1 endosymbiont]|nr:hypothetical protein D1AOALGA4SA_2578 [Olavius algarvensis Delta 1 endosymbiont]
MGNANLSFVSYSSSCSSSFSKLLIRFQYRARFKHHVLGLNL